MKVALRLAALIAGAVAIAVLLRWPALNMPLDRDQGVYATIGSIGGWFDVLPYRDVFDHKQPLIYVVHWVLDLGAPRRVGAIRLTAALPSALAAALLVAVFAPRIGWWRAGTAGLLTLICAASPLVEGTDLNTEHLLVLTAALPVLLALQFERSPATWVPVGVGALVALAALTKAVGLFVLPAALIPLLCGPARGERSALRTLVLAGAGVATPLAALALFYLVVGGFADLWHANYTFNRMYVDEGGDVPPGSNPEVVALVRAGLVAGLVAVVARRGQAIAALTLLAWLAGSVLGAKLAGRPVPHYFPPVIMPACALLFLPLLPAEQDRRAAWLATGIAAVAAVVVAWPFATSIRDTFGRTGSQLSYDLYGQQAALWSVAYGVGEQIRERARPGDRMFITGTEPVFYWTSGVPPASKYIYEPIGGIDRDRYSAQVRRDVCRRPPRFVVDVTALRFRAPLECLARLPYERVDIAGAVVYELQER